MKNGTLLFLVAALVVVFAADMLVRPAPELKPVVAASVQSHLGRLCKMDADCPGAYCVDKMCAIDPAVDQRP